MMQGARNRGGTPPSRSSRRSALVSAPSRGATPASRSSRRSALVSVPSRGDTPASRGVPMGIPKGETPVPFTPSRGRRPKPVTMERPEPGTRGRLRRAPRR